MNENHVKHLLKWNILGLYSQRFWLQRTKAGTRKLTLSLLQVVSDWKARLLELFWARLRWKPAGDLSSARSKKTSCPLQKETVTSPKTDECETNYVCGDSEDNGDDSWKMVLQTWMETWKQQGQWRWWYVRPEPKISFITYEPLKTFILGRQPISISTGKQNYLILLDRLHDV